MISKRAWFFVLSFVFTLGVVSLGYLVPRTSFYTVWGIFAGLFLLYLLLYQAAGSWQYLKYLLFLSLIVRLALLFSFPQWSDDYVRFVWDGQLLVEGQNPYELTPSEALKQENLKSADYLRQLYPQLNSPHYHSIYPPSNQIIFGLGAMIGGGNLLGSVMVIRMVLILFEMLAIYLIYRLLLRLHLPVKRVALYALNPLVILELTGNLHFEGMMLVMILGGAFFLLNDKPALSGSWLGAAVAVKLSPLILAPGFVKWIPKKDRLWFIMGGLVLMGIGFAPFLWGKALPGFSESLGLYADKFEFNASVYYLLRQVGYWTHGYNLIGVLGPFLKGLALLLILVISFKVKKKSTGSLFSSILLVYWVSLLLNTVVHPWYILPAVGLSLFTEKRAFLVWSFLIFISYHTFQTMDYWENKWLLGLEYIGVFMALGWDYSGRWRRAN